MRSAKERPIVRVLMVTLLLVSLVGVAQSDTKTWNGAVNSLWSNPGNWNGGLPAAGDRLVFSATGVNRTMTNDLAAGTVYYDLTFLGNNYVINGSSFGLSNGISSSAAPNTINVDIQVTAPQTMGGAYCCGPLILNGTVYLGSNLLTFDYQVNAAGYIIGSGGLALGDVITLGANNTYTGPTTISQRGEINGIQPQSPVTTSGFGNAVVSGSGTIGAVTLNSGAQASPGQGFGGAVGRLTCGGLTMNGGSFLGLQINGAAPATGYDQLMVNGSVAIAAGSSLFANLGFAPTNGQTFVLVDNDGIDPVSGTFDNLPEGATLTMNASEFQISYVGGTGNDIVLTVTAAAKTWTGAASAAWTNAGNWLGGVPGNNDPLVFPSGAANLNNTNDITDDVVFRSLLFSGSNYTLNGMPLAIANGITSTSAPNTINNPVYFSGTQTVGGAYCCGPLNLNGPIDFGGFDLTLSYQVNVAGSISGTGGLYIGDVVTLSGNSSYTGPTTVSQRAQFDGVQTASAVTAAGFGNATVSGQGSIGVTTLNSGAALSPGQGFGGGVGKLTTRSLTFNSGSYFQVQINGTVPGVSHDQVAVVGSVAIDPAASLYPTLGFTPSNGQSYVLIDNDGADPVNGSFNGLPEGTQLTLNASTFKITYIGGTGNDVVLSVVAAAKTWTGAVSNVWSLSANWLGGVPGNGDPVVFPAGAANLTNYNDLTNDVTLRSILFSGSNYVIGGLPIQISNGITSTAAPNTIDADLVLAGTQTMGGAYCCGPLNLNGSIALGGFTLTFDYVVNATGVISGSGGIAIGDVVTLSGNNTYAGPTTVSQRGQFDGTQLASAVTAGSWSNATVSGKGSIGGITLNSGASLSPGQGFGGSPGKLTATGLTMNANSYFHAQLNGSLPGVTYDQGIVNGGVALDPSAGLFPSLGFTPAQGQVFVVLSNDGTDPVSGTFSGLPQGMVFNIGPYPFEISYIGKTGNDITLTSLSGDPFNRAPVAVADAYATTVNVPLSISAPGVMGNDSDLDFDPLTVVLSDSVSAQGGIVGVASTGAFTYVPPTNFTGSDTFTYIISDGNDATDMATVTITVSNPAGTDDITDRLPERLELREPRPNPGRGPFEMRFGLPAAGKIRAEIFDVTGRQVARLADRASFAAGYHPLHWDGRDASGLPVPGGIYFVRVNDGRQEALRKLVLLSDR